MVNVSRPTEAQAEWYGRLVEAGVPSRAAVDAILPEAGDDVRTVCADEWWVDSRVLAARIALNGGKSWAAMSDAEQIAYALRVGYAAMAFAVVSAPPTLEADATGLRRVLDFIDRLEAQAERIGKAGAPVSGRTGWEDFQEQLKKTDPELAAALKPPDPKKKRIQ